MMRIQIKAKTKHSRSTSWQHLSIQLALQPQASGLNLPTWVRERALATGNIICIAADEN
jgi:hypothetical protein